MACATQNLFLYLWARPQPCVPLPVLSALWNQRKNRHFMQHFRYTTAVISGEENAATVESLYALSVDIKKIRRLKPWVLSKEVAYVKETAEILQEMGADRSAVAYILERCPEAILCRPTDISCQRDLWLSVCRNEKQLVELVKRFPESFFTVAHYENQTANIRFFQDLGLKNTIISRLLTGASNIFYNPVEKNKHMIDTLQSNFLSLGGSRENMKNWLLKLLSQNPFILLNSSAIVQENLEFLQKNHFTDSDVLSLLSKLKGFIFQLNPCTMQDSMLFSKNVFKCSDQELKDLIIKCPALLYYSVPVLEERLEGLLKAGISVDQIKETPAILELTTEIVQYRIKKLAALGYNVKSGTLEHLNGTKKDFEATYGKIQAKRERPLFNPVAPLRIED
ncbi:transcription termination factor 2, mitochondrial isoform X2 [Hemicordylus capensis]|nr:transcription termination factor 2, mitochondrial isoform X2 [Hemicordylus capensis]XP_053111215.1 transcription termination factor 2, mitochondrial isoform X2 [Hemicordylus capensis]